MTWVVTVRLDGRIGSGEGIAGSGHDGREGVENANERRGEGGKGKKGQVLFSFSRATLLTFLPRQAKNRL
jgi:hypothetical protein